MVKKKKGHCKIPKWHFPPPTFHRISATERVRNFTASWFET